MTDHTQDIPSYTLAPQQEQVLVRADHAATQAVVGRPGALAADGLRAALEQLVSRHEILRTTFVHLPGLRIPQQVVHDALAPAFTITEGSLDSVADSEAAALDLEQGPVFRAALTDTHLVLTAPAACLDAPSMVTVVGELLGDVNGEEPLQYADYVEWRRQLTEDDPDGAHSAAEWWGQDPKPFGQTLFLGRAGHESEARERIPFALPEDVVRAVRDAAEGARATPALFLEACLHAFVGRVSGEPELTLAALADGRAQPDLAGAVGPYAQLVPVRTRVDDETTFAELLDQVGRARATAAGRQDFATSEQLTLARSATIAFAYVAAPIEGLERLTTVALTPLELVVCERAGGELAFELVHDPAAYDHDEARRIAASFAALAASAAADPSRRVSELSLLDEGGRDEVLGLADGGSAAIPTETVRQAFERHAAASPQALAVTDGTTRLSYGELNDAANRLAHLLRARGLTEGGAAGVFLDRSPDALVAILGTLKAGAAFVPLNFEHPASRLEHQLREAEASVVVTRAEFLDRLPGFDGEVVCLDRDDLAAQPDENLAETSGPNDVAYVMYTSGSTGLPKGVAVTQENVANYAARLADRLGEVEGLSFAVVSALSTDLGYTSIFPALAGGGAVHLVPPDVVLDPDAFAAFTADAEIDVLKITPSLLGALLAGRGRDVLPRRWLVCGGEAFTHDLLARIRDAGGSCRILNHYGPTETTIGTCALEVEGDIDPAAATVPIGRPFPNARAYVVDGAGEPTPVGVAGELWIGGRGVARGYLNRPDETAERFADDPFAPGGRVYRTGDRARFLRDGSIEFLGRVDQQVKIRGYRVEPGEVEAALLRHDAVRQAAVVVQTSDGEPRLAAYVVGSPNPTSEELRAHLADWVPEYMLPAIAFVEVLPLTPSGKIDRLALAELRVGEDASRSEYVAPRNDLEREIAEIWQELLGVERVGVTDDFFALGGHSLLATQMITRIRRRHGNVPLRALFNAPTISSLAEVVADAALPTS